MRTRIAQHGSYPGDALILTIVSAGSTTSQIATEAQGELLGFVFDTKSHLDADAVRLRRPLLETPARDTELSASPRGD